MSWEIALAGFGLIFGTGGVAAWVTARGQSRKLEAEAELQAQEFYSRALREQNEHIGKLEGRINDLTQRVEEVSLQAREAEARREIAEERREVAEERRTAAETALMLVWAWVDAGAKPPAPDRPGWMRKKMEEV